MRISEAAMGRVGGVGAQRPFLHGKEPKMTGARSARARTHGQTPLVFNIYPDQRKGGLQLFLTHLFYQGHYLACGLDPTIFTLKDSLPYFGSHQGHYSH